MRSIETWMRGLGLLLCVLAAANTTALAQALLNDSGQTQCGNGSALVACTPAVASDTGSYPRQDARFGRDAAAAAGQLTKLGCKRPNGSVGTVPCAAGFDFTAVCFDGTTDCTDAANTAGYSAKTGTSHGGWSCTRDNVTGLTWALYVFTSSVDGTTNDKQAANISSADTAGSNAGLCGFTDWRLPSRRELVSIVNYGVQNPAIDGKYFPNTSVAYFWTRDPYVTVAGSAWNVFFGDGYVGVDYTSDSNSSVRLVRGEW